nr:MAG TPA: hypothetical protein [Caudoviricetes sp.]
MMKIKSKKPRLKDCNKDELIWIVNRILQRTCFNNRDIELERALNDLWYEKEKERINKSEKLAEVAKQKWDEYIDILKPYDGCKLIDIPVNIVEKATKAYDDALAADKKWMKIMGLEDKTDATD